MSKQLDLVPTGDIIGVAIALALILIVIKWLRNGSQVPGPMQVPFFGYLPLIGNDPVTKFLDLSQKYGQVYKLSFLARDFYVISGFSAIKESLSKQAVNDKPLEYNYFSASVDWNSVSALNGARWKQQRKIILSKVFALTVISDMSPKMVAIGQDLVKFLESTNGQETNIRTALSMTALNTVSSVVYSKRYDWEDELFKRLRQDLSDFVHSVDPFFFLLGGPYFKMYMEMFHGKHHSDFVAICKRCLETSMSIVDEKLNSDTRQHDFTEAYLREHRKEVDENIPLAQQEFTLDRLARTIFTLIQAGTDTTAETLYYAFYFMARYRDVQAKVQAEIDTVVGRDRRPTLADKSSFVYTRAVIEEILRFSSLVPMGVPRQIQSDIEVAGYRLPKGSFLVHNLYSVLRDTKIFEKAEQFYPEHFIDSDGNFSRAEATVPFGFGRRNCIGETLARNELFVYLTTVLQNFDLTLPSDQEEPAIHEGLFRLIDNYKIIADMRQSLTHTIALNS